MTTKDAGGSNDPGVDVDFTESVASAKRDMVLRFVKDQESLQTSQVVLKIVDDETIDLIDSALVVKGEEPKLTSSDNSAKLEQNDPRSLLGQTSALTLDAEKSSGPDSIIVPRPPSGRPRTRSLGSRKRSVSRNLSRQSSVDNITPRGVKEEQSHFNTGNLMAQESIARTEIDNTLPSTADSSCSDVNLNASWPRGSRKLFIPFRKKSVYATGETPYYYNTPLENFSGIDNHSESLRPRSSQSFQRVRAGEILTARISSASECERISCDASSLTRPPSYANKVHRNSRRRTYINFNRLDAQIALEGPLELEQVHPSELPLYRSSSAASSSAPYTLVHVPPIGREGPAPSSS